MRWRRGVTNIIFWIYDYVYFLSSPFARFPPSPCRYAVLLVVFSPFSLLSAPLFPHPLCFPSVIFLSTSLLCFPFSCHDRPMPYFYIPLSGSFSLFLPLSVMFSSSCYVANLAHHPLYLLIENRDDSGGSLFNLSCHSVCVNYLDHKRDPSHRTALFVWDALWCDGRPARTYQGSSRTACTPYSSLAAVSSFEHGSEFPTTRTPGWRTLSIEYGHRGHEPREGSHKHDTSQGRFWFR